MNTNLTLSSADVQIKQLDAALHSARQHCDELAASHVKQHDEILHLRQERNDLRRQLEEHQYKAMDVMAHTIGDWFAQHDTSKPIDPRCMAEAFDWLVNNLGFDPRAYKQLLDAYIDEGRARLAREHASHAHGPSLDEVAATLKKLFPNVDIRFDKG